MAVIHSTSATHDRTKRCGFTLLELLVVIAVIAVLVAILLPAIQQSREAARRSQCSNNLRQLSLALLLYHDAHTVLPPGSTGTKSPVQLDASEPHFSWTVQILPYIDARNLYERVDFLNATAYSDGTGAIEFDEYGDPIWMNGEGFDLEMSDETEAVPNNRCLYDEVGSPGLLQCPSSVVGYGHTNYVGLHHHEAKAIGDEDSGLLFLNSSVSVDNIPDGRSLTALLSETILVAPVNWATGTRSTLRYPSPAKPRGDGRPSGGFRMAFQPSQLAGADNEIQYDFPIGYDNFNDLLTDFSLSSEHPGGFHVTFADGRVQFISESASFERLQQVVHRSDAAPLSEF